MKRIILVSTFFLLFTSFMPLNAQWAITYGGDKRDSASSVQQTSEGGYIVAGYTESFGAVGADIWILKLSAFGEIEWQRTYEGGGFPFIQQTRDGGFVIASGGFLILKLSSEGEIEWQKTYRGGDYDYAYSIRQTNDDGYVVAGKSESFSGPFITDIWILKLSLEGEIEWQKTYGGNAPDEFHSIQQTSEGGYIVAAGTCSFGDPNDSDIWILKLSSTGAIEWQKTYGGSSWETDPSVQQTDDGGYIVASTFGQGGGDIWILKLSSEGVIEWQKKYGGSGWEEAHSICQTSDGGYIVAGSTASSEGSGCYDSNALILKLSSDGNIEWQKEYGGKYGSDDSNFIQQTGDGGYIVAGEAHSWGVGGEIWVLKLTSNGDINPTCAFIKSSDVGVIDTDISPENTYSFPKDTYIAPQDEDITPQESDAVVYELCSEQCTLTLTADYGGTTEPEPGTYTYETGTEITLKAIVTVSDLAFSTWAGNVWCDHNPVTIIMDGDKSIEARFYMPGYQPGGEGGGRGNGCFTMELASGSPLYHYIGIVREFRDKCLKRCKFGCALIKTYYEYSPFLADLIVKHKLLKIVVRINLLPLVIFSYSMLRFGPLITAAMLIFIFALSIFFIRFYRRK